MFALAVVIPVADWIAPDKLILPPVIVDAIIVPTVALDAATLPVVTLDAATSPVMFALAVVIPIADWIAPDKLMLPPVIVDAITVPALTFDAAMFPEVIFAAFKFGIVAEEIYVFPDESPVTRASPETSNLKLGDVVPMPKFPLVKNVSFPFVPQMDEPLYTDLLL